jgi:hypothetical protein
MFTDVSEKGVGIAAASRMDSLGSIGGRARFFSSPLRPERLWGPPSLLYNGYGGGVAPGLKRLGREADHTPPSRAEVKNGGTTPPFPHVFSWHSAELIKHGDNSTFSEKRGTSSSGFKSKNKVLATFFMVVSCLAYSSSLKMEATGFSETSFDCQRAARHYGTQLWGRSNLAVLILNPWASPRVAPPPPKEDYGVRF